MASYRYISVKPINVGLHVAFEDKFLYGDMVAEILKLELIQLVRDERPQLLIVDFTDVKAISSAVIGALMTVRTKLQGGSQLRCCSLSPSVEAVFKSLNLYGTVFQIFESLDTAIEATQNTLKPEIAMELDE